MRNPDEPENERVMEPTDPEADRLPDAPIPDRSTPLAGCHAVVTGGSKGIGQGIAELFVRAGANVTIVARDPNAATATVDALTRLAAPEQVVDAITADVSDRTAIDTMFDELEGRVPKLDVFVANAGTGHVTPFLELSTQEWDDVVALNLTGTTYCCQRAAQFMRDRPTPNMSIVVVSSIRALGARSGRLVYSATKAAVNQMVRVAALDLAPLGIRVNALSPGITATPLTAANPQAFREAAETVPLGRAGRPGDIAEGALFLASPASAFVTGVNLVVDGGESLNG